MPESLEHLQSEILQLPVRERAELALVLIRSLDDGGDQDAEGAWDIELTRRMDQIERGDVVGESADGVFARLREKYP